MAFKVLITFATSLVTMHKDDRQAKMGVDSAKLPFFDAEKILGTFFYY